MTGDSPDYGSAADPDPEDQPEGALLPRAQRGPVGTGREDRKYRAAGSRCNAIQRVLPGSGRFGDVGGLGPIGEVLHMQKSLVVNTERRATLVSRG